ncbi:InlB B-repeat-containing protein [Lysinibacillus fusiformis]|uniref:InlB B-repeat-containing protein n=3 Tax=Lysinibacillus fusiformis TaxID=28031 RepID=UPI003CF8A994
MKKRQQVYVVLMLIAMLLIIVQPFLELQVARAAVTTIFPSKIVTGTVFQGMPNSVGILEEIAGVGGYDSGDQTNTAYVKFYLPSNYDYSNAKLSLTPIPGSDSGGDISNLTINIGSSDDWTFTEGNTYSLADLPSNVGIEKDFSKPAYSFNNFDYPILLPIGDLLTEQNINDISNSNIITLILSSPNMKDDYAVFNNISLVDFNTSPQVKHTVSFETDGGSAVPSQTVVNGSMSTMPEIEPTKAGYTFGGWYKDVGYTQTYDFTSVITEATTIYAKWNAQMHTVSFEVDGGSAISHQSVAHGGKATMPQIEPTKAGYTFGGWYTDAGHTQVYDFTSVITEATTIYAKWNAQMHTVSFEVDGGSAISHQSVAHGGKATMPYVEPTKAGYTFGGWYTDASYTQTYDFNSNITGNMKIYAKWNAQMYTVSFNTDGGSAVSDQSVAYGEKASAPTPAPTKAGYTFEGWYTDAGHTQVYDFTNVITENTTIYAKWNAQTYTVSFNTDGGSTVSHQSVAHGGKANKPTSVPTKAGYTFGGWYSSNTLEKLFDFESGSITRNMTIYAKWISNVSPPTSNNSSSTSGSSTPTTNTERIIVEVEGEDGINLSKTPITRTTMPDGVIKDHVSMSEDIAKETIEKAKQLRNDIARIIIPDTNDKVSEIVIEIPKSSIAQLSSGNIKLEMATANVVISIPNLLNFYDDLYFRLVPIKTSEQQHRVEERIVEEDIIKNSIQSEKVHLIGRPMTIETNMQNRPVTLTLPLPKNITQEQLDHLAIFIEHSDGTKELVRGKVVDYQKDMQGLQFEVQKFSTFSMLYLPENVEEPTTHIAYIRGNADGTFRPNAFVTRAQMASMFARQLTVNAIPTSKATFTDTVQHDAKDAIEFVKHTGLFNGVTEASYQPNGFISRAQMAVVAARWIEKHCVNNPNADFCKPTSQSKVFKDVSNNHWAVQAIHTVNARDIMTGTTADTFDPEGYLTRAQAVKILNHLFERQVTTEHKIPIFKDVPSDHWAFNEIQEAAVKHIHSK